MSEYERQIQQCCANTNYTLEESAQLEADLIMKRAELESLKYNLFVERMNKTFDCIEIEPKFKD